VYELLSFPPASASILESSGRHVKETGHVLISSR
jgi:hypothetical protein